MSEFRKGYVYVQNRYAGILEETDDGYTFGYDTEYLLSQNSVPCSLTLPLRSMPYVSHVLFPFFDGLIPEGWLLDLVTENWKLNRSDRFGILLVSCRDCIGDVRIEEKKV